MRTIGALLFTLAVILAASGHAGAHPAPAAEAAQAIPAGDAAASAAVAHGGDDAPCCHASGAAAGCPTACVPVGVAFGSPQPVPAALLRPLHGGRGGDLLREPPPLPPDETPA